MLLAPTRLSMTICWPSRSDSFWLTMRAMVSELLPAVERHDQPDRALRRPALRDGKSSGETSEGEERH